MTKKIKNAVLWTYVSDNFKGKELFELFKKNNCKKKKKKKKIKESLKLKKELIKKMD